MGQWTQPARKGWDDGLSLLGKGRDEGPGGGGKTHEQAGEAFPGRIYFINKEKWEIYY